MAVTKCEIVVQKKNLVVVAIRFLSCDLDTRGFALDSGIHHGQVKTQTLLTPSQSAKLRPLVWLQRPTLFNQSFHGRRAVHRDRRSQILQNSDVLSRDLDTRGFALDSGIHHGLVKTRTLLTPSQSAKTQASCLAAETNVVQSKLSWRRAVHRDRRSQILKKFRWLEFSLGLLELLAFSPPGFRSIEVLSPPGSRSIEVLSHISLQIMDGNTQLPWALTGFYGNPVAERRQDSWQMLRRLTPESPSPWLIMGDFNEIISQDEKFTWSNKREGTDFTKERLDRACANATFPALYGSCVVQVLPVCNSDHNPLSINCNQGHFQLFPNARLLFRYEAAWAGKQEFKDIIASSWSHLRGHNSSLGWFKEGLMRCRDRLQIGARFNAREAKKTLKVNMQKLRSLQQVNKGDLNERIRVIQNQVDGQCLGMVDVVLSTQLIRTGVGAKVEYGKDFHLFQWQYSAGNKVSRSSCR
ncbi:unnamed protein product [Fraxinus pennsylvanica]|uniref:Endonuclease/exonuclease/phosphatase domain-containing protein n=1 Tax=Fraxinus pennsylvanica TaxID=56036 RepID=A0AAD1YPU2_9LAMI|nr:unnamed protein product [Fraxinus pennsylvanica]